MKFKNPWLFVSAIVLFPIMIFGIVSWYELNYKSLPVLGNNGHRIGNFEMTNQLGTPVTDNAWKNKIVVVDFFFTHCPSICPKMTKNLKMVQEAFVNDNNFLINSFSVDPERDSVNRLAAYASLFNIHGNWNLLTGSKKEIYRLARQSFLIVATDGDGGPNDFIHSEKLILIDKEKRIRGYYNGTKETEVKQLIKDISRLRKEKTN